MSLFQPSVLKKYLAGLDPAKVGAAYERFRGHFADPAKQENIRNAKEEQYQEGFLRELFVDALGYTLHPATDYNLTTEFKNLTDARKADGAVLLRGAAIAVIELKGANTTDFKKIEEQAFRYKNNHKACRYVVTSNFERLRFYVDDATEYEEFDLFQLDYDAFARLYLCLAKSHVLAHLPADIKAASVTREEQITKKLYADYSAFKRALFADLCARNPAYDRLLLFKKTQKLLDRLLFIFFAEDRGLLPPNSIHDILLQWQELRDQYDEPVSLYSRFRKYFGYMNTGHSGKKHEIFGYNGGLFAPDDVLDAVAIDDTVLFNGAWALTRYDFMTDVDVDILGHIFEHSLNEIEEIQNQLSAPLPGGGGAGSGVSKRKKDGVFYTPKYITRYIVDNTVGALCRQKQAELGLRDEDYADKATVKTRRKELSERLSAYQTWLENITILDPACGSGAFLNSAFSFLQEEHARLDRLRATLFGDALALRDADLGILEHNLFGVDLNEESVEIAQLALWLRTAKKGRKLSSLSQNIRCGNSLVSDPAVAGDKAFDWQAAFPTVFAEGGFDVVVGNPPYGAKLTKAEKQYFDAQYATTEYNYDTYTFFLEKSLGILKPDGFLGFIVPNTFLVLENGFKLRQFLFERHKILQFLEVFNVFDDAVVEPLVTIMQNSLPDERHTFLSVLTERKTDAAVQDFTRAGRIVFEQKDLLEKEGLIFNYRASTENRRIAGKMLNGAKRLSELVKITAGVKPYEKGKGTPPQTQDIVEKKPFNGYQKIDETWLPLIRGTQVRRYVLDWDGEFVKYGDCLAAPRQKENFTNPKVFIRRTDDRLLTVYDDQSMIGLNSIHCLQSQTAEADEMYFMVLLNSKLLNWYFRYENFHMVGKPLAEVKIAFLERLPAKIGFQKEFVEFGKSMLHLNRDFQTLTTRFLRLLTAKHPTLTTTRKLADWPALSFGEFLKEIRQQKIVWSLKEEAEWMDYFTQEQSAARALRDDIRRTDAEIDRLVYALYGLTAEEIAVVEGVSAG